MQAFYSRWGNVIFKATIETFQMVTIAMFFAVLIGLPLGVLLTLTRKNGSLENRWVYQGLNTLINLIRSIPFIILLFYILPFTKLLVGTSIGVKGVIVPLVVHTAPFVARLMESALLEVDRGVVEAYEAMGVSTPKIIWYVIIREARPAIVLGLTMAIIALIGATAMAGLVGAGGLGNLAYSYGHLRYEVSVMHTTVLLLIVLVQCLQSLGNHLATRLRKE
ncbi:methionine ABC transporter permease [Anoxynatronum buryatiense]|uniref:D-methionine transport system permease protein n=1 Tax=Anoxynatronum buryatiense TaxID=489973 RepID=A0AA45WY60_9CLOT|nr:methionine ABC transporter permease [Anoxynatronum buryatiense]SMP66682.1 D-methionine transport system permease protein [Anoxynatronum buryatiense]